MKKIKSIIEEIRIEPITQSVRSFCVNDGEQKTLIEIVDTQSDLSQKLQTEISFGKNARVKYIFLLDENVCDNFFENKTIEIMDGAHVQLFFCFLGSKKTTVSLKLNIKKNVRIEHNTLFLQKSNQKITLNDVYNFQKPQSFGRFAVSGILAQRAHGLCTGMINIEKHAQKIDSRLDMKSTIIGSTARSSMVPSLEIKANDVKAGHSATISKISEDQLFYMQSRGLSEELSKQLFLQGVFNDFCEKMNHNEIQNIILGAVKGLGDSSLRSK